jgi:hypothetical protein
MRFSESDVEQAALAWLAALGYAVLNGPDIAAGEPGAERSGPNYRDVLLEWRLRQALVGRHPDLTPDALETNDSAVQVLGDDTLRAIARELVETVRKNVTIDWTLRENVRAQPRVLVKRILRKHGYPPDKQKKATQTVLKQAEVLSAIWAGI